MLYTTQFAIGCWFHFFVSYVCGCFVYPGMFAHSLQAVLIIFRVEPFVLGGMMCLMVIKQSQN